MNPHLETDLLMKMENPKSDIDEVVRVILKLHSAFVKEHTREIEQIKTRLDAIESFIETIGKEFLREKEQTE